MLLFNCLRYGYVLLAGWAFEKFSINYCWLADSLTWLARLPDQQGIDCQICVWLVTPLPGYQTLCSPAC